MPSPNDYKAIAPIAESEFGCACFNVRRASRAITQLYEDAMQQFGLKATQFSTLVVIGAMGEHGISAAAEALVTDRTTVTRNVTTLIAAGYVEEISSSDRRARPLRLTAKGRRILTKAQPVWRKVQEQVADALGSNGMRDLKRLSDRIVNLSHPGIETDIKKKLAQLQMK